MIKFYVSCLVAFMFTGYCKAQTVCATADENGTLTLTAPPGKVFDGVVFASYGTPNGTCGSFTLGSCNSTTSTSFVFSQINGLNTASIAATNANFGDPCVGTFKRLYVEVSYKSVLGLSLLNFYGNIQNNVVVLSWKTSNEINTSYFDIERSADGRNFTKVSQIKSLNINGENLYTSNDNSFVPSGRTVYYRLKMVDINGSFTLSNIIKVTDGKVLQLTISPNPVVNKITINGLMPNVKYQAQIMDAAGKVLNNTEVTILQNMIDLTHLAKGSYFLKVKNQGTGFTSKFIKQ